MGQNILLTIFHYLQHLYFTCFPDILPYVFRKM